MKNALSLSVRIAEGFLSKEETILNLDEVTQLAHDAGFNAICMRASQLGVQMPKEELKRDCEAMVARNLPVTMVTGNFDIVYNKDNGPDALRNITPFLDLAEWLNAPLIRIALKTESDIPAAQRAADEALERGTSLVHQCHTLSLFETLESCEATAKQINRPNFGIIYEPANLEICGQPYTGDAVDRLRPWIKNVYLQNQIISPSGEITLKTWCRGPVSFDLIPVHAPGGIDFDRVFSDLHRTDYEGPITVHQSAQPSEGPLETSLQSATYLRSLMASHS